MSAFSWIEEREILEKTAASFDKSIVLIRKDCWIGQVMAWLLFIVSFGRFRRSYFLNHVATCLGPWHFYPKEWSADTVEHILSHEARHTKQCRWLGLGIHPILGLPLMAFIYIFLPLPIGLAYGRFLLERDADKASWSYLLDQSLITESWLHNRIQDRIQSLSGFNYIWPWPKSWVQKSYIKLFHELVDWY